MGRIVVHTHGKPRERAYGRLVDIYMERLASRGVSLRQHSDKMGHSEYIDSLEADSSNGKLILLDESGESGTTEWFVNKWKQWKVSSVNVHIAVGPVDGYDDEVTSQYEKLSLGPMTMTYELAVVALLEQLYRASEVERGSPYHRE